MGCLLRAIFFMLIISSCTTFFDKVNSSKEEVFQSFYQINQIKDLQPVFEKLTSDDLVVWDIDEVLTTFKDAVLNENASDIRHKAFASLYVNSQDREYYRSIIFRYADYQLVESEIHAIYLRLKANRVPQIALSSAPPGKYGIIEDFTKFRVDSLKQLGIDFSTSYNLSDQALYVGVESPRYRDGVITSGKNEKGEVLEAFLKRLNVLPKKIVFIDDKKRNLLSVKESLDKLAIDYEIIHYAANSLKDKPAVDQDLLQAQIFYLRMGNWFGDERIKSIIKLHDDKSWMKPIPLAPTSMGLTHDLECSSPVRYYSDKEVDTLKLYSEKNLLMWKGEPLNGQYIFVMMSNNEIILDRKKECFVHHSSLIKDQFPIAAGYLSAKSGKIESVDERSGHFAFRDRLIYLFKSLNALLSSWRSLDLKISSAADLRLRFIPQDERTSFSSMKEYKTYVKSNRGRKTM